MNKKKKTVAIVGRFNFPFGDAASTRVIGIGKILKSIGYDVVYIGKCMRTDDPNCLSGNYQDFRYFNIPNKPSLVNRAKQVMFSGKMTIAILKEKAIACDIIIYYGNSATYLQPLLKYVKKNNIKLITDIVEWYDPVQINGGKWSPMFWDMNFAIQKLIPKCDGVIAISSFLQKYFIEKGMTTIRIPQLFDLDDEKWKFDQVSSFDQKSLNLLYAGVPAKKDSIDIIIKSVKKIVDQGHSIKLHLFGPSPEQIQDVLGEERELLKELGQTIVFHGRINQNEIPENLAKADFSVLIRPNMRYANAGFPTKFVESLAAGLPVIANLTSDIGLYLHENTNGFIVTDNTIEALVKALTKAINLDHTLKSKFKAAAQREAEKSFYYKKHIDNFDAFISKII